MTTLTFDAYVGPPLAVVSVGLLGTLLFLFFLFGGLQRQEKALIIIRDTAFSIFATAVLLVPTYFASLGQIGHDRARDALATSGVEVIDLQVLDLEVLRGRIVNDDGLVEIVGTINIGEGFLHYATLPKN